MNITLFDLASRFIGIEEVPGTVDNPMILAMLKLTGSDEWNGWPDHDEVAWCSAALNYWAWLLRLPRSKSLLARSWLGVGEAITKLADARKGFDILVFARGDPPFPGADDMTAPGHVAVFAGWDPVGRKVHALGGNQGNRVSVAPFPISRLLGVRRLWDGDR